MGCEHSNQINCSPVPQQTHKIQFKRTVRKKKSPKQTTPTENSKLEKTFTENVKLIQKQLQGKDLLLINETLEKHFLFYKLSKTQRLKLIECMEKFVVSARSYIFQQGDQASYAFFLSNGSVEIIIDKENKITKQVSCGEFFGDLALLYTARRSASAYAKTQCVLWGLSKENFQNKIKELIQVNSERAKKFISNNFIFQRFSQQQKKIIASCMHEVKYQKGNIIFRVNDAANSLYVLTSGQIQIQIPNKLSLVMRKGQVFGENCLKKNEYRNGTARAIQQSKCLVISREQLSQCLDISCFQNISYNCVLKWALKRSVVFEHQPKTYIQKIIYTGKIVAYNDKEIILKKGQKIQNMFICLEGRINNLSVGGIIYDSIPENQMHSDTQYKKQGKGAVFVISHRNIDFIFGRSLKQIKTNKSLKQIDTSNVTKRHVKTIKIQLANLEVIKRFESNQKSTIFLVSQKNTRKQYILKCIKKNHIIMSKQQTFLQREKKILINLTNPYIVSLYKTFKDQDYIYMLMKYFKNGDFSHILEDVQLVCSKKFIMFYAANLILRLEYLHSQNIVYRDLKPENCVLDQQGYLCLIDFGIAKQLRSESGFRTFSIVGTPHYMAPQIHQGFGYSFQVDIWSLGVMIYFILFGFLPYGENFDDPYDVFSAIQHMELSFPTNYCDQKGKQFLQRLLIKNSSQRILNDFNELKKMKFFQEYSEKDWKSLREGTYKCPYTMKESIKMQHEQVLNINKAGKNSSIFTHLAAERKNIGKPLKSRKDTYWDEDF